MFEASSGVKLVMSISARNVSPRADFTARRPRPSADASGTVNHRAAAATPVKANRPVYSEVRFKASPNSIMRNALLAPALSPSSLTCLTSNGGEIQKSQ